MGDDFDMERESYANLCDELNDPGAPAWNESDWDPITVAEARGYARKNGLRWPPGRGDFDRWYEEENR